MTWMQLSFDSSKDDTEEIGEIGKLKAEIGQLEYRMHTTMSEPNPREQKYKPEINPPRLLIFGEVDHLEIEARVDKMWEKTEGIKTMVASDLKVFMYILKGIKGKNVYKVLCSMHNV